MAVLSRSVGYECEFVDQVPEDYFCKQCSHVAREPAIATCCGETFCGDCINTSSQAEQPCSACQEPNINFAPQRKNKTKILALKVYCSLKDRGCKWTGQLQHLDAHLDLTTGDCVYVNVDCPSKCNQKVQKHNVDTHLANHCPNRDYTCPHCSFKATFREVSEHFEVCRYYTLVCPNRCGASFERDVLEDHMKMCGLQKLQCEFSYAGCRAEFIRDDQKEHMEQNTQKHLALVAAALKNSQEQQQVFEQKLEEQQRIFDQKLEDIDSFRRELGIVPYKFTFADYQKKKTKCNSEDSLYMYTHAGGYKFKLWVRAPPLVSSTYVTVHVLSVKSDHDNMLKLPAEFTITLKLLNQHRDQDHHAKDIKCKLTSFGTYNELQEPKTLSNFILETDLAWNAEKQTEYLKDDCLQFQITRIHMDN